MYLEYVNMYENKPFNRLVWLGQYSNEGNMLHGNYNSFCMIRCTMYILTNRVVIVLIERKDNIRENFGVNLKKRKKKKMKENAYQRRKKINGCVIS